MEIPKEKILDLLRQRGEEDMDQIGIDPQDLLGQLGGVGDKFGL
jgi:hypothetical protein